MGTVHPLPGHHIPGRKGEASPEIVAQLENLLQEAKDGQIVSFAYALYRPSDLTGHGWSYGNYAFHLAAAIMSLHHGFCQLLEGVSEER